MSNKIDTRIHDKELAHDMAIAEKPFREAEIAARLGAEAASQAVLDNSGSQQAERPDNSQEIDSNVEFDREALADIVRNTFSWASFYTYGRGMQDFSRFPSIGLINNDISGRSRALYNLRNIQGADLRARPVPVPKHENSKIRNGNYTYQALALEAGVGEVATFATITPNDETIFDPEVFLSEADDEYAKYCEENPNEYMLFTYSTVRGDDKSKFPFPDSIGRDGNQLHLRILLPMSVGEPLSDAALERPELVHQLIKAWFEESGFNEREISLATPDYNEWRKRNAGKLRLAFRWGLGLLPENSQVVEY